jgi:hypothetical protein
MWRWLDAAALVLLVSVRAEAGCPEPRPTEPAEAGYSYGDAAVASFGGARVRVWYATEGKHAPDLTSTRSDGVPDHVALTSQIAEEALAYYEDLGFRGPLPDDEPGCDGGDGRVDLYLMAFAAADGLAVPIRCKEQGAATRCASFLIAERRPQDRGYASFEEGARTIVPHELFHAVQNAHDAAMDRYWAEGTAQWAADRLAPWLGDLERFLPAFLGQPRRPMDLPPGGVTASFLYGSAIWPVFLDERHGPGLIRAAFDLQAEGQGAYAAVAAALLEVGASPPQEVLRFRSWNASTGARAASVGVYKGAEGYPEVPYEKEALEGGQQRAGVMAGLSAVYHPYRFDARQRLELEADPGRILGVALPVEGGRVLPEQGKALPAEVVGEGVVVLAGVSEKKTDAAYTLRAVPLLAPPEPAPSASSAPPVAPVSSASPPAPGLEPSGGCSAVGPRAPFPWGGLLLALLLTRPAARGLAARARRTPARPPLGAPGSASGGPRTRTATPADTHPGP